MVKSLASPSRNIAICQSDVYFMNDIIVYFKPGSHTLNNSLKFMNLHNFTWNVVTNKRSMETHCHNISYHDDSPFHTGIMAFIVTNGASDSICYNNFSFTGMAEFRENSAVEGGAIKSE